MSACLGLVVSVIVVVQGASPPVLPREVAVQGATREALERAYDRLCSPPLSDLDFVLSDLSFKLTRRFTDYSGDISGRMLGALISAGPVLGQDTAMVAEICSSLSKYQKTDGHFGADQDLAAGLEPKREMPILWGNGRLLLAVLQRYRQTQEPPLLKIARGIGDYVVHTHSYFGKPENLKLGGSYAAGYTTCYPSLIEGMALLAEATQDGRYLDEARHIAHIALQDTSFEHHHSHGRLAAYRGMLEVDRVAGTAEFLPVVEAGCAHIASELILPTGGLAEIFDRTGPMDEGCSEVDWIMVNMLVWRATGNSEYLDAADFALRNHLLAAQFANGGFGHRLLRTLKTAESTWPAGGFENRGYEAYWCCSEHGTQLLGDIARWAVVASGKNVLVTWLAEVRARLTVDGRPIRVAVVRSGPGRWQVNIEANGTAEVPLQLRVPGWTDRLVVEGKAIEGHDGWAQVLFKTTNSTTLMVEFAESIRLAGAYGEKAAGSQPRRILAGPDLFCLPDAFVPPEFIAADAVPRVVLAARSSETGEIPVVVSKGKGSREQVATSLVPMLYRPAGGCRFLFDVEVLQDGDLTAAPAYKPVGVPAELVVVCDGESELFVNGKVAGKRKDVGECSRLELYVDRGPCVLAIKARSKAARPALIGMIRVGERIHVTTAQNCTAVKCPVSMPAYWLTDSDESRGGAVKLTEIGGFGDGPLKYMPAEFAGTNARWIWPEVSGAAAEADWLIFWRFEVP